MSKLKFPVKLNLGCGTDLRDGYINIDTRNDVRADLVHDITEKFPFMDGSVKEIVAQDVIEHLTGEQQDNLFKELYRILTSAGKLEIRIPNYDSIIDRFSGQPEIRNLFLFGDTSINPSGAHKSNRTLLQFITAAVSSGFSVNHIKEKDTNFEISLLKIDIIPSVNSIVFINQSLGIGGAEFFNSGLLRYFHARNVKIECWVANRSFANQLTDGGITTHHLPIVIDIIGNWKGLLKGLLLMPFGFIYYLWLSCHVRKANIILMSGFIEKILITPWAKLLKIPIVWIEFGPLSPVSKKFFGFPNILYTLVSGLPDRIIVPSLNTLKHNFSHTGISQTRTDIIPCAEDIHNTPQPGTIFHVCCVSRFDNGKGQDILVRSWKKVIETIPQAHLYLVGEGSTRTEVQKIVNELQLSDSITFTGWVADALSEINKSQLVVFPSVWELEGFGMVMLEAMALRKPIIAFEIGPVPELITDGENGILVSPQDVEGLAKSIITLLKNPALCIKLGSNGYKRYKKYYTFSTVGAMFAHSFILAASRVIAGKAIERNLSKL